MKIARKGVRLYRDSILRRLNWYQNDVVKLAHELNEVKSGELED